MTFSCSYFLCSELGTEKGWWICSISQPVEDDTWFWVLAKNSVICFDLFCCSYPSQFDIIYHIYISQFWPPISLPCSLSWPGFLNWVNSMDHHGSCLTAQVHAVLFGPNLASHLPRRDGWGWMDGWMWFSCAQTHECGSVPLSLGCAMRSCW